LGAIYWSRPDKIYFANTKKDAAEAGFDDQFIYEELTLNLSDRKFTCEQLCRTDALKAFEEWKTKTDKVHY
jgi:guanine deaminase